MLVDDKGLKEIVVKYLSSLNEMCEKVAVAGPAIWGDAFVKGSAE